MGIWGAIVAAIGVVFVVWGSTKSMFVIYRLLVARSRILWGGGGRVHRFYQVAGMLMIIVGAPNRVGCVHPSFAASGVVPSNVPSNKFPDKGRHRTPPAGRLGGQTPGQRHDSARTGRLGVDS